jgi:DNA-binding LytR/AlgR family response regulator
MRVIIIEDEKLSAEHLESMLLSIDASIQVIHRLDSVKQSIPVFQQGIEAELLFLDIHLADGTCFDILENIAIDIPIIFTTAYDTYAIKAFKHNSIDYLLKPIAKNELQAALEKFNKYKVPEKTTLLENISLAYQQITKQYKNRFMVKSGNQIESIKVEDILHFQTQEGISFLCIANGKRYPINYTLDQLEGMLSPVDFFRMNRKVILRISSIEKVSPHFNSRLSIHAKYLDGEMALVSRERVNDFKQWLDC